MRLLPPTRRADGRMIQDYQAGDDHGVISAQAVIALDLDAVDRRFGLTVAPEPRAAQARKAVSRSDMKRDTYHCSSSASSASR